jgi:pimeloyl-ACP methyl ester carboxylesterase
MIWLLGLLALYLALLLLIVWVSLHPFRIPIYLSPAALGTPQEEVEIQSEGATLRGWWVPAPGDAEPLVMVLAHGYMMNRSELVPEAFQFWQRGVSCLIIDQRCHGRSGGKKCTLGYLERHDIAAAVAYARSRAPGAKIGLLGSSMGAAASALAMSHDPSLADVVILDSCYGRLSSATLGWWRFVGGDVLKVILSPTVLVSMPLAGFNPFQVDISRGLAHLKDVPVLFFHGRSDTLALPGEAMRNFEATPGPKEIVWFDRCGHSEGRWEQAEKYHRELFSFLERQGFLREKTRDA